METTQALGRTLKWNTGRQYTDEGQRISCCERDGGVVMYDIDRRICYFLPGCELDRVAIMARYDNNEDCRWFGDWEVREQLAGLFAPVADDR